MFDRFVPSEYRMRRRPRIGVVLERHVKYVAVDNVGEPADTRKKQ